MLERPSITSQVDPRVQVAPEHYDFARYDDAERWMSYWHQLRMVLATQPASVLDIGSGSGVFPSYLRRTGVAVTSVDIDRSRGADVIADVRDLDRALPSEQIFDAVCAFQVLEHVAFEHFESCLASLLRRSRRDVFVSLPYRGLHVRFALWWGDRRLSLGHKFMLPWRHRPIAEHHWELGYPLTARRVSKIMHRHANVVDRRFIVDNPYHYVWRLQPPGAQRNA